MIVLCLIGYFDVEAGINILLICDWIWGLPYACVGVMAAATVAEVAASAFFGLNIVPWPIEWSFVSDFGILDNGRRVVVVVVVGTIITTVDL